jgi:hypothetical protein
MKFYIKTEKGEEGPFEADSKEDFVNSKFHIFENKAQESFNKDIRKVKYISYTDFINNKIEELKNEFIKSIYEVVQEDKVEELSNLQLILSLMEDALQLFDTVIKIYPLILIDVENIQREINNISMKRNDCETRVNNKELQKATTLFSKKRKKILKYFYDQQMQTIEQGDSNDK